ncbi:cyclic GMP-AMP synthase DncV-like nucleotidyltransferase [Gracilibacillus sp. YIM 98692]|uniref:nucleotide-binding domain-containing protein n=1 Tax=Gracilibacillus sp. YIM 98692 TaxID=2663532 RepID=UPI0013D19F1E|nr:hypothetical protein [Gracilibacillus sp. YIM 98692]
MLNLHNEMKDFHDYEVKLSEDEANKLRDLKGTNIKNLKSGLSAINDEKKKNYALVDDVVQGSMAMHTVTQNDENDYDIDVAVIFDKDNIPSSALDCRKLVEDALRRKCTNFVVPPTTGKNAVRVQYQAGYHIDFAVYRKYKENEEDEEFVFEHAGPSWNSRHPKEIRDYFNQQIREDSPKEDDEGVVVKKNQMRRIIRLLKMFCRSRSNWSLPGGIILTTLVDECYVPNSKRDDKSYYDTLVAIKNRIMLSNNVNNPTDPSLSLTPKENHKKKVTRLKNYIEEKLIHLDVLFESDCTIEKGKKAWKKFLKHDYWTPEEISKSATNEMFTERTQYPETYRLEVRYVLYNNSKTSRINYITNRRKERLNPKHCNLHFEAIHNVPVPYEILWEVNNNGDEAQDKNDISHSTKYQSYEGNYHWEGTSYKGTHSMTVKILRSNNVVAKREVKINIV